jgi:hypothetical protein
VCEHYYINENNENIKETEIKNVEELECFICYDATVEGELVPKKLSTIKCYTKTCECDVLVHEKCLDIWVNRTNQCPICRKNMYKIINSNSYKSEDNFESVALDSIPPYGFIFILTCVTYGQQIVYFFKIQGQIIIITLKYTSQFTLTALMIYIFTMSLLDLIIKFLNAA